MWHACVVYRLLCVCVCRRLCGCILDPVLRASLTCRSVSFGVGPMHSKKYVPDGSFSQSLKGVHWRFLREAPVVQEEPQWHSPPSTNQQHTTYRNVQTFEQNSRLPRSGAALAPNEHNDYNQERLKRVRELEHALTQSEFPSQILKYLSVSEEDEEQNKHLASKMRIVDDSKDRLMSYSAQKASEWSSDAGGSQVRHEQSHESSKDRAVSIETSAILHAEKMEDALGDAIKEEVQKRTNVDNMFNDVDEDIGPMDSQSIGDSIFDDDDESDRSRSPSPIIIWRPAARVKVATDVPPELLEDLLEEEDEEEDGPFEMTAGNASPPLTGRSQMSGATITKRNRRVSSFAADHIPPQLSQSLAMTRPSGRIIKRPDVHRVTGANLRRKKGRDFKKNYGAWYIKPDLWKDCASGKGEKVLAQKQEGVSETEKMRQEMARALDETSAELEKKLPKLFITKQYRTYLIEQSKRAHTEALPLPHYLNTKDDNFS